MNFYSNKIKIFKKYSIKFLIKKNIDKLYTNIITNHKTHKIIITTQKKNRKIKVK